MERTPTFIKIWFWPRGSPNVPSDVLNGSGSINTDTWGIPTANYPNTLCDIDKKFTDSNIIINLTLCELSFFAHGAPSACPCAESLYFRWRLGRRCLCLFRMPGRLRRYVATNW